MWGTSRFLLIFVLFSIFSFSPAFKNWKDMNWENNPEKAWTFSFHQVESKVVILLLNQKNYTGDEKEWKFIASGVLLDNSRILTSYNPFRELISNPEITDNILALLPTGYENKKISVKISNLVCARQIAYVADNESNFWSDKEQSPIHDLMVIRIEEEIGIANASYRKAPLTRIPENLMKGNFYWPGQLSGNFNSVKSFLASVADGLEPEVHIFTLGYMTKKQMRDFDTLHEIAYEADDAALMDCEEWLPRQWGFFICIKNIGNFPSLGSGATLFSKDKLFGIGSFAMFKMDEGILVFTDVRPYHELIEKTCGDEEFDRRKREVNQYVPEARERLEGLL